MEFIDRPKKYAGEIFKFEKVGQSLTGVFMGTTEVQGKFDRPSKKHLFKTDTGLKVVFGSYDLNSELEGTAPGSMVRVTFTGTKKTGKGQPMKEFKIADAPSYVASEEELAGASADDYEEESDLDTEEQLPPPAQAPTVRKQVTAESQNATMALLRRGKTQ